jgi:hypothetical protein
MGLLKNIFPPKVPAAIIALLIRALEGVSDARVVMGIPQLEAGLLRYMRENPIREPNYIGFTYDPVIASRFEDPMGRALRVTNIRVQERKSDKSSLMSVYFSRGLVSGYAFEKSIDFNADVESVDNSLARLEFLDLPESEVLRLVGANRNLINWSDVFEVYLDGREYFHLKSLDDGDFVAVDLDGSFYEVTHDPFELNRLPATSFEDVLAYLRLPK